MRVPSRLAQKRIRRGERQAERVGHAFAERGEISCIGHRPQAVR
jgi:hypothetical protein